MRIRPATRHSRRILKTTAAACALSATAAGTLFATQAGAATTDSSKEIKVFVAPDIRCFAVMVDSGTETIFGSRFQRPPAYGIQGDKNFVYWNFDSDAVRRQGGVWEQTLRFAPPGSTVTVWTNQTGCGHLVNGQDIHVTYWTVPHDSLKNVWVYSRRTEEPR